VTGPADLYGLYAQHYDAGRATDFAGLFTVDAVFRTGGVERARGRAAIEELASAGFRRLPGIRHYVSSVATSVDGDEATGGAYVSAVQLDAGLVPTPVTTGRYVDRFVRVDGRWLIDEHSFDPFPEPEVSDDA